MKKATKILKGVGVAALAMGLIPYRIRSDKETGSFEVDALLWSVKKTAGEENDQYDIEVFSKIGGNEKTAGNTAAPAAQFDAEETEVSAEEAVVPGEEPAPEGSAGEAVAEQTESAE